MAIIGKIREKSWLLVIIIGLALLAFILGDYYSGRRGMDESEYGYGTVFGEKVDYALYDQASNNFQNMDKNQFAQQQREYTAKDLITSENKAWNAIVDSIILQREFDALGINVSDREFDAYLYGTDGFDVLPDIAQSFTDPQTGAFNLKMLQKRVADMKSSTDATEQQGWENTKKSLSMRRQQEKYFMLLNQGVYATKLEAKDSYKAQNEIKSISYTFKRLNDIPDDEIKISDADLQKYYEEHKEDKKYEIRNNSREIKYFDVIITPSKEDSNRFNAELDKIKTEFATKSGNKADSLFVMRKGENPYFVSKVGYKVEGDPSARQGFTYPKVMDTIFKTAEVGTIVGPYFDNGSMKIAKVIGVERQLLSVRHILISAQRADSAAVKKAQKTTDSLMLIVNSDNFEELVSKHSQDPGSNTTGGKYEDFIASEMVPEFSDFAKANNIGKIGYVQTDFGFHIMEVLDKKAGHIPNLAVVTKTLVPSQNTIDDKVSEVHNLLYDIDEKISKAKDAKAKVSQFDTIANRAGYFSRTLNLEEKNLMVYGMNTTYAEDKLIELGFDSKNEAGTLYPSPIKDGNRYIIAMLAVIRDKGVPTFDAVELAMKRDLMNEKKANKIKSTMTKKSLDQLAKANGSEVMKADITFGSPQIPGGGYEPEVVGMLFGPLKDGQTTQPIVGKSAVYVIRIDKTTKPQAAINYVQEQQALRSQAMSNIQNDASTALRERAQVVDNRRLFKIGVRR